MWQYLVAHVTHVSHVARVAHDTHLAHLAHVAHVARVAHVAHDPPVAHVSHLAHLAYSANNARQIFPVTYQPNGYIDVLSAKFIEQNKLIHGSHVIPFITPYAQEVDTEEDFKFLEYKLMLSLNTHKRLFD